MKIGGASRDAFALLQGRVPAIQAAMAEDGLDGWLLYDLQGRNPVAGHLLGLCGMSRRYFVLVPTRGEPVAVTHGIEQGPWEAWTYGKKVYVGWSQLDAILEELLDGRRVAMEISSNDAVPAVDLVPCGVRELVEKAGADVVSSGKLISRFYARWDAAHHASHMRASRILASTARDAFERLAGFVRQGEEIREGEIRTWLLGRLEAQGVGKGSDSIVANGVNAANPHYETGEKGAVLRRGDVVLIDLWGKEADAAIYADQTWMGYLGPEVPARVQSVWAAIRDARDAGIALLEEAWTAGRPVQGYEVDDAVRSVIQDRGLGAYFIHRTGHAIDTETHGMGPNIDNLETHETRELIPGVGFSIEPGVYIPGEVGLRTEINVYISEEGPVVTSPDMQREIFTLLE